ncbi:hypothetical protein CB1_000589004 [Camelus ferus]|nr:hypothetical protein CB1_000589004 [Camelus ferus]
MPHSCKERAATFRAPAAKQVEISPEVCAHPWGSPYAARTLLVTAVRNPETRQGPRQERARHGHPAAYTTTSGRRGPAPFHSETSCLVKMHSLCSCDSFPGYQLADPGLVASPRIKHKPSWLPTHTGAQAFNGSRKAFPGQDHEAGVHTLVVGLAGPCQGPSSYAVSGINSIKVSARSLGLR